MKAIEQHFHVVLFIMLYKVVLTCTSLYETIVYVRDHSNEGYWTVHVLSCGTVNYAVSVWDHSNVITFKSVLT